MSELSQVIDLVNNNIHSQTEYFKGLMDAQNQIIKNQTTYFESKFDAQSRRQDAHGAEQRAGFDGLNDKVDSFLEMKVVSDKETDKKIQSVSSRVTILETRRLSGREFFVMLLAIIGSCGTVIAIYKNIKP